MAVNHIRPETTKPWQQTIVMYWQTAALTLTRYISHIPDMFDKPAADVCVDVINISQRHNDMTASITAQVTPTHTHTAAAALCYMNRNPAFVHCITSSYILTAVFC